MAPMRVRRGSQSRSTARYALAKSIAKMEGRVNGWMVGWDRMVMVTGWAKREKSSWKLEAVGRRVS